MGGGQGLEQGPRLKIHMTVASGQVVEQGYLVGINAAVVVSSVGPDITQAVLEEFDGYFGHSGCLLCAWTNHSYDFLDGRGRCGCLFCREFKRVFQYPVALGEQVAAMCTALVTHHDMCMVKTLRAPLLYLPQGSTPVFVRVVA
jgi:hypothetical protein